MTRRRRLLFALAPRPPPATGPMTEVPRHRYHRGARGGRLAAGARADRPGAGRRWPPGADRRHAGDADAVHHARRIAQAEAGVGAAEASLREAVAGARPREIERAEADLRAAEAEAVRATRDLERLRPLADSGTVSRQSLDAARADAETAVGRRERRAKRCGCSRKAPAPSGSRRRGPRSRAPGPRSRPPGPWRRISCSPRRSTASSSPGTPSRARCWAPASRCSRWVRPRRRSSGSTCRRGSSPACGKGSAPSRGWTAIRTGRFPARWSRSAPRPSSHRASR